MRPAFPAGFNTGTPITPLWGDYPHLPFAAPILLRATPDNTGGSGQSGGVPTTEAYPVVSPQYQTGLAVPRTTGLAIQCPDEGSNSFAWFKATTGIKAGFKLSDAALIGIWVYTTEVQGGVLINFSSDNHATKRWEFSWPYPGQLYPGWNLLTVRPDDLGLTSPNNGTWTIAGGMTAAETINSIGIGITSNGGAPHKIWVDDVFYWPTVPAKGSVIFGIDGFGTAPGQDAITQYLAAGIKPEYAGDGYLVTGAVGTFLDNLYAQGGSVFDQGGYTTGLHTNYTSLPANLQPDINIHNSVWDRFPRNKAFWSWAFSAHNPALDAVLKENFFLAARGGDNMVVRPNYTVTHAAGAKMLGHGSWNIGNNGSPVATQLVLNRIDMAANSGVMVYLMDHGDFNTVERATVIQYAKDKAAAGLVTLDTTPSYVGTRALGQTLA